MKKCPPGVICLENITLLILILIIIFIISFIFSILNKKEISYNLKVEENNENNSCNEKGLFPRPSYSFSNLENDVLLNPYQPPVRDNRIFPDQNIDIRNKIPINVPTQSFNTEYRQIGILSRSNGNKETILPLMGAPLINNKDKWNFYTMSENNNMIKLPVSVLKSTSNCKKKGNSFVKCMGQNGCNDLNTGDIVNVAGYNETFTVTTYENDMPKYIPYIPYI